MIKPKTLLILISLIALTFSAHAEKMIGGNTGNYSDKTFNFKIGQFAFATKDDSFQNLSLFVTSANAIQGNKFAVSKLARVAKESKQGFVGLCPQKAIVNNAPDRMNPLLGAKINALTLVDEYPVVVKDGENKIYLIKYNGTEKDTQVYYSSILNDANGKPTNAIIKLASWDSPSIFGSYIFAAVKNNAGQNFGNKGSGIALVHVVSEEITKTEKDEETDEEKETKIKQIKLSAYNADSAQKRRFKTNDSLDNKNNVIKKIITLADNKAAPLNGSINAVKINNDAYVDSDILEMYWDRRLARLFIGLSVKSNEENNSGARAIIVGRMLDDKLYFDPIVPENAVLGQNNKIIATGNPGQHASIYKIRSMYTSTLLNYLIVAGGNGKLNEVGNKIYALPLVSLEKEIDFNARQYSTHSSLAKYDQKPKEYYAQEYIKSQGRRFVQAAQNSNDLLNNTDQSAIVGDGDLPLNPWQQVSDMFVLNDSVFACINQNYNGQNQPGIFYSQAIFNHSGSIVAWTKWQRISGSDRKVIGAILDPVIGQFWTLSNIQGHGLLTMTNWGKGQQNNTVNAKAQNSKLVDLINASFPLSHGGVHGLFDFSKNTPGLDNLSLLIATGYKKIAIALTGKKSQEHYRPIENNQYKADYNYDGKMTNSDDANIMFISGGAIEQLDSITCAEIVTNRHSFENWMAVGGVNGLAVLQNNAGYSWIGNLTNLNQLNNLEFKKLGDYKFIQKIQSVENYLYVLTDKKLDRINLNSANNFEIVTLAQSQNFGNATFNDFAVSDKFALLATTSGLYRIGNGCDINQANNATQAGWTYLQVPESLQSITKIFSVSTTGLEKDFAYKGQVYVLSAYRGSSQSKLNRFFVDLRNQIDENTILPLRDLFIKNNLSNFFEFGDYKETFYTNGALNFATSCKDTDSELALHAFSPRILSTVKPFSVTSLSLNLEIENNRESINQIGKIVKNSANGALLISGNFGLRVNQ